MLSEIESNAELASCLESLASSIRGISSYKCNVYHSYDMWLDIESARKIMADIPGRWEKAYVGNYVTYSKGFSAGDYPHPQVSIILTVNRDQVCRKIQTGSRQIPAREAYDEPIYEWECGDSSSNE